MHARVLLVLAALALPTLSVPVASTDHVVPKDSSSIVSRSDVSVIRRMQDLFRRVPIIEALPEVSTYDVFVERRSEDLTQEDEEEDLSDETEVLEALEASEKKGIRGQGANPRSINPRGVRGKGANPRGIRGKGANPRGIRGKGANPRGIRGNGANPKRSIIEQGIDALFGERSR